MLGHELWQRRYGADPAIIGRTIRLAAPTYLGEPDGNYQVIGVLQADAWLFWKRTDLVLPLRADGGALADPRRHLVERVVGRLRNGTSLTAARLQAPALLARLNALGSDSRVAGVIVDSLKSSLFRDLRPQLLLVLMIAILVLVLAGLNVVISASAQALEGQRDTAVRLALGATPGRLAVDTSGQLAVSVVAASAVSLLLATWFIDVVVAYVPEAWLARVPGTAHAVHIDGGAAVALALVAAGIVCTTGAWTYGWVQRLATGPLLASIQPIDKPRTRRWRAVLVSVEIALCATTVIVATALLSQLWHLRTVDLGVRADRTAAVWINASPTTYADPAVRAAFFERLVDDIRHVPGIEAVAGIDLPFHFAWQSTSVRPDADRSASPLHVLDRAATPTYLETAGLTLLHGRWIDSRDRPGAPPVAVISQSLADVLWSAAGPVGRSLQLGDDDSRSVVTVIGVVSDTRPAPQGPPSRTVYRPVAQAPPPWLYLLVRTRPGTDISRAISTVVWRIDPDQPVEGPWAVRTWIEDRTAYLRFLATLTALLAGLGVVLAAAGVHGLMTYWVEASGRELGIRRTIGASDRAILAWYTRRWLGVVGPALAVAALMQVGVLRVATTAIEGLQRASVGQIVTGGTVVVLYAAAASAFALWRALRVDAQVLMR